MPNVSLAVKVFNPFQVLENSLGCQTLSEDFCCETQNYEKSSKSISQKPSPTDFHPPAAQAHLLLTVRNHPYTQPGRGQILRQGPITLPTPSFQEDCQQSHTATSGLVGMKDWRRRQSLQQSLWFHSPCGEQSCSTVPLRCDATVHRHRSNGVC